jgi:hypothetical protein
MWGPVDHAESVDMSVDACMVIRESHGLAKPSPAGMGCQRARARVANFDPQAISTCGGLLLTPARVFFSPLAGPQAAIFVRLHSPTAATH